MIDRLILAMAFTALAAPLSAEGWSDLPSEMVLISPQLASVEQGFVVPRIVHASVEQEGEFTRINFHFLASSIWPHPGQTLKDCNDATPECLGNVKGALQIRLREQPTGDNDDMTAQIALGGAQTIDKPNLDIYYSLEMLGYFSLVPAMVAKDGDYWTITTEHAPGPPQTWREMSLARAADATLFAGSFGMSLQAIGNCIVDQVGQLDRTENASLPQQELLADIDLIAAKTRESTWTDPDDTNAPNTAMLRMIAAQLLARETGDLPDSRQMTQNPAIITLTGNYGDAIFAEHADQIVKAAAYERRRLALDKLVSQDEKIQAICNDLAGLAVD